MHLILTGATGLVGSGVLDAMLHTPTISKISILSRRPVQMAEDAKDPRIEVIIHKDFASYDGPSSGNVLEKLQGAEGCVWALGISQTQVNSEEEYVRITKDYALVAARTFAEKLSGSLHEADGKQKPFRFVYVSGEGATQNPGRFSQMFARVKGQTEQSLADMAAEMPSKLTVDLVRPAGVDASHHDAIKPYIPTPPFLIRTMGVALMPAIRLAAKGFHSPTEMLGRCFTDLAMGKLDGKLEGKGAERLGGSWVLNNPALRRITLGE